MPPVHVPASRVVDYNAFGTESTEDLLAQAEEWRELGHVLWTEQNGGHWVVLSEAVTRQVLSRAQDFSSAKPNQGVSLTVAERKLHVPLEMDAPEHRMYRSVLIPLFAPQRVQLLQESARSTSKQLINAFSSSGTCEVKNQFARPLASTMFLRLMDWPLDDRLMLEQLVDQWLVGPLGASPEERGRAKAEAGVRADAYCRSQVELRRSRARGGDDEPDMTSILMDATLGDGRTIPEEELVRMLKLLMIAGLDTVQSTLSRSFAHLGQNPDAQQALRDRRDDLPRVVEELLRWTAPSQVSRMAKVDAEFDGVTIRAGDTVHCLIAAVNRDPAGFENAGTVDFDRKVNHHLTFSVGPHKCIGSAMARVVLAAALDEFHQAIESYHVVSASSHLGGVWGMREVNLAVQASAA